MEWWKALGTADKAQVISAIATGIAAITALITTIQNHKSIKKQEEERHAMFKPKFIVTGVFENRIDRIYKIDVENFGYSKLNNIIAKWEGTENATTKLIKIIEKDKKLKYKIEMKFDNKSNYVKPVEGKLMLIYVDVLGKKYNESISLIFDEVYNDINEKYYLELENIYGEEFI